MAVGSFGWWRKSIVLVVAAVLFSAAPFVVASAAGQAATGTLLGNVRDDSGAGVPGVTVTATDLNTNTASHFCSL